MVHPALLRSLSTLGSMAGRAADGRIGRGPGKRAARLLRLLGWPVPQGYRPELHYMRGGRTTGAKSLAAG